MKFLSALFAAALLAGPAVACPQHGLPIAQASAPPTGCLVPEWQMASVAKAVSSVSATQPLRLLVQPKTDAVLNPAYVPNALAADGSTWLCTPARVSAFVTAMTAPLPAYYGGYVPLVGGPVHVRSHTRCNSSKCWSVRSYTRSR